MIQQHPILSAIPVDEDSPTPYFARLPKINLEDAVVFTSRQKPFDGQSEDPELDSMLEKHHNTNFKAHYGSLPFWRLLILTDPKSENEFVASFIYHHALGDGASGIIFQKHFYLALMSAPLPLKSKIISPPTTALLLNLELLHPLPIPAPPSSTSSNPWTAGPIQVPMRTVIQTLIIPKDLTSQFLHTCRAHSTTLTSTLSVLVARALVEVLPLNARKFKGTIPVNIRRFLPRDIVTDDDMGVWIDTMPIYYCRENLSVETLWKEAQRTRDVISTYLASSGQPSSEQLMNVARMKQRGDMREVFLSMVGQERDSTFEVSNLGVVKADEAGSGAWKMGGFGFSRSAFAAGAVFSIGVITGCDGCLNLGFSWQEGVMERKAMRRIVEGVRAEIERVVGQ